MTITAIRTTRLQHRLKQPYIWAQGANERFSTILIEVEDDSGHVGIGEGMCAPDPEAVDRVIRRLAAGFIGRDPFSIDALCAHAYHSCFEAWGASVPRFGNQVVAGLEMALWDLAGKITERPVHDLLGGPRHSGIDYFYFLQGESVEELAADAARAVEQDAPLVYLKVGRGEKTDLAIVSAVREAIGDRRLRLDANEAWDPLTAIRMIRKLERFEPEYIEQPTSSGSIAALAQVRSSVGVAIGADQSVYTPNDVYEVCRANAADLIVLGLHEAGASAAFESRPPSPKRQESECAYTGCSRPESPPVPPGMRRSPCRTSTTATRSCGSCSNATSSPAPRWCRRRGASPSRPVPASGSRSTAMHSIRP